MLGQIVDMILFPIRKFFEMLMDNNIKSYLGVSVLTIIVTMFCISIVVRALISSTGVGGGLGEFLTSYRSQTKPQEAKHTEHTYTRFRGDEPISRR